jgi:SAM-dependent methyltransferase
MSLLVSLDAQQVPVFETFVVPRFLSLFGTLALEMLLPCASAVVANLACRTGYPDSELPKHLPDCRIYGYDASEEAIELARTKAALLRGAHAEYFVIDDAPFPVGAASFSHVLCLYPLTEPSRSQELVAEAARLVAPGGQVLFAMPLRGSYLEVADLLREYALKHDVGSVAKALDAYAAARPTIETFSEVFEECGLTEVDVDVRQATLKFGSGREFFEDPITRLMVVPDLEMLLDLDDLGRPMDYVREAIDRYWSEFPFELSVNIGCASARGQ